MDPEYQFSSSKLEKVPIIDAQCCVNIAKSDQSAENEEDLYKRKNSAKCCTFIYLIEFLFATLILSFCGFMIYLAATSGYFEQLSQPDETYPRVHSIAIEPLLESHQETKEESLQNLYQYVYRDKFHERTRQQRSATSPIDRFRFKRGSDTTPCQQNMKHCESLINSMWRIVNIVNSSLPTLETYLKNTATDTNEKKSKLFELVECLQCKNDSIAFIDESGPENLAVNDHQLAYQHSDQAQIKNHIDIVTNLLNNNDHDTSRYNSSITLNFTGQTTLNVNDGKKESVRISTTSVFEEQRKIDFTVTTQESETRVPSARTMEYESMPTEVAMIDATTSGSTKAEGTNVHMDGIDDTKQSVVTMNVTTKDNVTEIANATVHPSVHPSSQGHGETRQSEREATRNSSKSEFRERQGRIVSKISLDSAPGTMPTAETIKSSQQLQLVPSMSWMPYQVCFYGPPPNGQMKQTAPGQITYPASSPGAPYPVSMPQTRPGFQNANPSPNYLMVQANSVQFSPPQSFQNSNTQPGNQRMGPIGPGMQNFPMFPGHQMTPSAGANSAGTSSYYCTYIPAPTFQFPAIPGVSEYQRSSNDESAKNEMESAINALRAVNENETSDQRILLPQYMEACPPNTIRCGDGQKCILRTQRCNGEVDCNDASDETTCTCRDRISQERLCDGYFDCPHGEDELGCLGCSKTSFSCDDWQRRYTSENCVPLSQRCDGVKQCANGKDEMDCNILTPSHIEGKNVFTIGYSEGYLHKNFKGQWYPVCTTDDSWVEEACISEVGQELASKPETKIHSVPDTAYQGPYLANVEGQMKLVPSCMNTAIFVRCPQFRCGTRIISRADSLRPHAVETEAKDSLRPHDEALPRLFRDEQGQRLDENDTDVSNQDEMVGSQLRIVGGRSSQPKAWPFLVAIYRDGHFYCGGVILNELWVLTAAHCLDGYMGHYYEIQAGMLRQFSFSPMAQFRKARYTVTHPQYTNEDMGNDIGMIMLDRSLHFNRWVRPVCLPGHNILGPMWRKKPEPGSYCVAIGWGATREHGPDLYKNRLSRKQSLNFLADHMREVTLPILDRCKYEIDQNEATICAGYPQGGRDACQGDSGGPLMCKDPYSESQWYVAGIVSHGEGCARPDEPGIYTRVSSFLNWIQETSNNQGIPPMRRTPLETCPGFSCEGGLGKCLPAEARCNQIVDCLDGEDELNCRSRYPLYRRAENPDSEVDATIVLENSTIPDAEASTDATLIYPTTDESLLEDEMNNEIEFDDATKITTTYSPNYTESGSSLPPTVFPTVFTCTRLLQSILMEKRCDRIVDCEDGSDEINCTCKDYLMHTKSDAICDGYVDCDDSTDEQNCTTCVEGEFFCKRSKTCIPMSKRCNAKLDCEFNEDELDCFTLTNGHHVHLDADNQPSLNIHGVLTRFSDGKWQPVCHHPRIHNSESTTTTIGKNMCEYFGFANLQSSESVIVKNSALEVIPWSKTKSTREENSTAASLNEEDERCPGLHIHCTPVLNGNVYTYYRDHVKVWPWLAAISVDGDLRCTALLLNQDWLLAPATCLQNVSLDKKYTVADMGYAITLRHIQGPHQQTSMIDEVHFVNNSVAALLHLRDGFTFSRQVRPLFLDRKIYLPGVKDTCEAVGMNEVETRSVFIRPILQHCPSCQRCFVNVSEDCLGSETSEWSGTIFCHGKTGWYPAAVFQDNKGLCSFTSARTMTSIDYINPYLTEVADSQRKLTTFDQSTCDGFRCNNGQCVPKNRKCDGIPDCPDQGDEDPGYCKQFRENCETRENGCICTKMELRCRNGNCVDKSAFCNEVNDCTDGSDEPARCTCAEYLKLTSPELLCDGVRNCLDKSDESPEMCPCSDNSFKCSTANGNDTCIPQDFICDNDKDCYNGEDEATCKMLKPLSSDSGTSGEMITRSYGVWHSECLPSPLTSEDDASKLCKSMGYSTGSVSNDSEIIEDPVLPKRDDFYIVKLNKLTWMTLRGDRPLTILEKSNKTCHRAFIDCI